LKRPPDVVMCSRYGAVQVITPGSSLGKCSKCDNIVHVAPSSRKYLAKHPRIPIVCLTCVPAGEHEVVMTPAQERELRAVGADPDRYLDADRECIVELGGPHGDRLKHTRERKQ
jgi:hypothetical protein